MSEYQLTTAILSYSEAKTWEEAKEEWALNNIYMSETLMICLCGHYPIKEICVLQNKVNANQVEVGNCCVKNFLGVSYDLLFVGLKKVMNNINAAFNKAVLCYVKQQGWIDNWEYDFYGNTLLKRKLSEKQRAKRCQINARVLKFFSKEKGVNK